MPKDSKDEKRPTDVIGDAVKVMRIATGEEAEETTTDGKNAAAVRSANIVGKLALRQ